MTVQGNKKNEKEDAKRLKPFFVLPEIALDLRGFAAGGGAGAGPAGGSGRAQRRLLRRTEAADPRRHHQLAEVVVGQPLRPALVSAIKIVSRFTNAIKGLKCLT